MTDYRNHVGSEGAKGADGDELSPVEQADDAMLSSLLLRFGADYNRPPDIVPREEMWHAVGRKRTAHGVSRRHVEWSMLAAAVLLLGVGIGVGMDIRSHRLPVPAGVATAPVQRGATSTDGRAAELVVAPGTDATQNATHVAAAPKSRSESPAISAATDVGDRVATSAQQSARSTAYTLATVRHFTAVEALLTSFQASSHDARGDAQMAAWARALLSQTRLLLDSPAASDPTRRKLLQDLELVLVQMTLLSPSDTPIDRAMINGSVRNNDVITRLRTAVPAGATHL